MATEKSRPVRVSERRLRELHRGYLRELRKRSPETRGTYERSLREFFRWIEHERAFRFLSKDVERYKAYLTRKRRLSPVSVSTYLTSLRQFFAYLIGQGVLATNPAKLVRGNTRPMSHSREALPPSAIQAVLDVSDRTDERGARDYAIVRAMIGCGLSEIELIRANIGDCEVIGDSMVLFVQGKGSAGKESGVILPPDVKEAFTAYLAYREGVDEAEPLMMSAGNRTRGSRMTTRGIRERVNYYLEKAGVKNGKSRKITPFSLRHTAAVLMAANGASVEELQSRFRIGTPATAMIYFRKPAESDEPSGSGQ